jgi:RHS repeat-associated protein
VIRTTNSTKPNLEFTYDASGNRIAKKVIQPNGDYKTTFYVRDASGNVMAVYKTSGTTNLTLEEQHIYGSSRLGIFKKDKTRKATTRALGERRYELTDHLGNVRVVLSDYKKAESIVISATDYYPFGMVARTYTSPEEYRYGFNGKEKEKDIAEGAYAFEYRIHDPRLGRFLSVDPWCYKYSYQSPYVFAHNTPVSLIDYLGLGDPPSIKEVKKMTTRKDVVKFKHKDYTMYFFKEDPTKLVISNGKEFHLMDFQSAKMLMPNSSSQIATEEETQQLYPDDQAGNYNRKGSDVWKQDFKATFEMLNFKFKNGDVAKDVLKEFLNTTKGQGINVTVIGNYGSNVNNNNIYKSRTPDVKFEGTLEEFAKERAEFVKTYLFGDNKYAEVYSRHELPGPNVMKKYGDIFLKPVGADPNGITIIFTFPTPKFK